MARDKFFFCLFSLSMEDEEEKWVEGDASWLLQWQSGVWSCLMLSSFRLHLAKVMRFCHDYHFPLQLAKSQLLELRRFLISSWKSTPGRSPNWWLMENAPSLNDTWTSPTKPRHCVEISTRRLAPSRRWFNTKTIHSPELLQPFVTFFAEEAGKVLAEMEWKFMDCCY